MQIKSTLRRINRKYRQIVNLTITAIFLAITCAVIMEYQSVLSQRQLEAANKATAELHNSILARQDSLIYEIDRLKIGISDATQRTFKVTAAANAIKEVRKELSDTDAIKLATMIYDECERSGVEFAYVLAVIQAESRFNHKVTSNVGAQGIMQIMPLTFISIAKVYGYDYLESDVTDLRKNLRIGTIFLHRLLKKTGSHDLASAAYNGGPKVAANYKRLMTGDSTAVVPAETQNYVVTVNSYRAHYRKILGE